MKVVIQINYWQSKLSPTEIILVFVVIMDLLRQAKTHKILFKWKHIIYKLLVVDVLIFQWLVFEFIFDDKE